MAKKKEKGFKSEFKKQMATLITGAFSFVAALVWRDAIMEWMQPFLIEGGGAVALTGVAILVTIVAVVAIYGVNRISK